MYSLNLTLNTYIQSTSDIAGVLKQNQASSGRAWSRGGGFEAGTRRPPGLCALWAPLPDRGPREPGQAGLGAMRRGFRERARGKRAGV